MDNFDKEMSDRYLLVRTSYNCFCLLMFQEEPLMPPAMAARSSPPEGIIANHPVGNTANLPKWLVPGNLLRESSRIFAGEAVHEEHGEEGQRLD